MAILAEVRVLVEASATDRDKRDSIRAFVAIELSDEVKADLGRQVELLRQANLRGLRLVRPEGVHLTLKFLGETSQSQVAQVAEVVRRIAGSHGSFSLRLADAGVFPPKGHTRVFWVGLGGDVQELARLQRGVEQALAALGFAKEARAFTPHLTLARMNDGATPGDRRQAAELHLSSWKPGARPMRVEAVSLMRSHLNPNGATYERLAHCPLGSQVTRESGD
jgi:2'-5' RNA ligase